MREAWRALLRILTGGYLGQAPARLAGRWGERGKPMVSSAEPPIEVSLSRLAPGDRPAALASIWTAKEARLKATGEGIHGDLRKVEVPSGETWFYCPLESAPGYIAAIVARHHPARIRLWEWREEVA